MSSFEQGFPSTSSFFCPSAGSQFILPIPLQAIGLTASVDLVDWPVSNDMSLEVVLTEKPAVIISFRLTIKLWHKPLST